MKITVKQKGKFERHIECPNETYARIEKLKLGFPADFPHVFHVTEKNTPIIEVDDSKQILLLPDQRNWAFDNIANAIIKYNPYPKLVNYTKLYIGDKPEIHYDEYDLVYVFFEAEKFIPNDKYKVVRGCYSSFWTEFNGTNLKNIGGMFRENRGAIFVNDIFEEQFLPYIGDLPHTIIRDSADETVFYPIPRKNNKKFTAIFVGNTERKIKNFKTIVEICEEADVELVVANKVPHEELVYLYNSADVCINYSDSEGGPQTFIEAALCGVPMLIRGNNSLAQRIPCFTAVSKKGMVEKLQYMKAHRLTPKKIGKWARRTALKEYTYKETAKKFTDFFISLL